MKILMVSSYLPYPLYSGGHVRLYNLLSELSKSHEITLICEKRNNQNRDDIAEVEKICKKVITIERKKQWSFGNVVKTTLSSHSFLVNGHTSKEMKDRIMEELESNSFDIIHVETFYVIQNLPEVSLPVVLVEHNIEHQVYKRFLDGASVAIKPILAIDIAKIKREEEAAWRRAARIIVVSDEDKKVVENTGLNSVIVANGVDTDKFSFKDKSDKSEKRILFIGDFKWIQNRDSVKWIIEEIWTRLRQSLGGQAKLKLWIVGRKIPDSIRELANDADIIFDEESSSKSTEEIFHEADILLAPIRVGGGTSYKILEAMSCGTPVVTTKISADALGAKDGEHLLVGNSAAELAERASDLINKKSIYNEVAKNSRKLIEEKYTWSKIAKDLEKVYKEL